MKGTVVFREVYMHEQLTRQVHDMFEAVKDARIPDHIRATIEDNVDKTRASYEKITCSTKGGVKALEEAMAVAQFGAKNIGEKILRNADANAEAVFAAAHAMARAKTLPEAAQLYASFVQEQLNVASAQTKELVALSAKTAQQTFASMNVAATTTFEQFKNVG
jgi:hypothetical protein